MLQTCLALRRQLGNPTEIAATLTTLWVTRLMGGHVRAAAEARRETEVDRTTVTGEYYFKTSDGTETDNNLLDSMECSLTQLVDTKSQLIRIWCGHK